MALVKFGMIVTDMRGSLGGHVFTKGRSGAVARTKVTPINPQTTDQQAARSRLGEISQTWRTLTGSQRDAWNSVVEGFTRTNVFGDSVQPTGKNLFTALNINLINIGGVQITDPPTPGVLVAPAISDLIPNAALNNISMTINVTNAEQDIIIYATPALSAGISFVKSEFRQIAVFPQLSGNADLTTEYLAKFGNLIEGQKIFVKVRPVITLTGQAGVEEIISQITQP